MGEDRARSRSRNDEQKTPPQPLSGVQGQGGARGGQGDKTVAEIAQKHDVHPNQVTEWRRQLLERATEVFAGGIAGTGGEPAPDLKELHAKIGQQALEIDFLAGALTKAGLLSAKR